MSEPKTDLTTTDASVASMLQTALAAGQSPETLERLFALYERMEAGKAEKALSGALAAFQRDCPFVGKTTQADRYKYEHIADVAAIIKPHLAANGLSYSFTTAYPDATCLDCTCTISHDGGAKIASTFRVPLESTLKGLSPAQKSGAAMTYAMRRSLEAVLGITPGEDTDGASAAKIDEGQAEALCIAGKDLPPERWAGFLKWAGVEAVEELPLAKFQAARRMIDKAVGTLGGTP